MPQKILLSKAPLIQIAHSSLSKGMVRVSNPDIKRLYDYLSGLTYISEALEPAFSLSCLLKNEPLSEKPAKDILKHLQEKTDGSFIGNIHEQISIARAALSLFEYTTDRNILNRLVSWCRFLETEWDTFKNEFCIRIHCADLMEFLVKLYRISGVKAILRICAKLRSASFDWVSYLHNEKCRGFVFSAGKEKEITDMFHGPLEEEIDYFQTQYYINHAELVADAVRYSAYAGIYSGNSQELSAGKTGWSQIYKEYHTACGGTSGAPFFDGNGANSAIHSGAIAAWTEAFAAQSMLSRESWAMNELILLVFNALPVALRDLERTFIQRVNTRQNDFEEKTLFSPFGDNIHESVRISCRLGRAVTAAYHHAITLSKNEICINYLIHGMFFIAGNRDPIILQLTDHSAVFRSSDQESHPISLFIAQTETDVPVLSIGDSTIPIEFPEGKNHNIFIRLNRKWEKEEGILFLPGEKPFIKECHHQGLCCYLHHHLMVLDTQNSDYAFAAIGDPKIQNNKVYLPVKKIKSWKIKDGLPADIPVRPKTSGESVMTELRFYKETRKCISVFPKAAENE